MAVNPGLPIDRGDVLRGREEDIRIPLVGEAAPRERRTEIPWSQFVNEKLRPTIDRVSSRYLGEFEAYWGRVAGREGVSASRTEIQTRFLRARVLYDMLRVDGEWGYRYSLPPVQRLKHPPELLHQIIEAAGNSDGAERPVLFEGDCDDVSFLYADLATTLGLSGITVEMVSDNHVNVVVPITAGLSLVLDPTGVSTNSNGSSWDLPAPTYVPGKGEPAKYDKRVLRPLNAHYRNGRSPFLTERRRLTVGETATSNLIVRIERGISRSLRIPQAWEPLVRGMRHSIDCYKRHLGPYTSSTGRAAARMALGDTGFMKAERSATTEYLICLSQVESPLERFGVYLAYLDWARCGFIPPEEYGPFDPLACMALLAGPFISSSSNMDRRYHQAARDGSGQEAARDGQELISLRSRLQVLDSVDPSHLPYPLSPQLDPWLRWIAEESDSRRGLFSLLGALSHTVNLHGDSLEE